MLHPDDVHRLVFLDESSIDNTAFSRKYGRAYEGRRAYGQFPKAKKGRISLIVAIGWEGLITFHVVPGSATADDFAYFMMYCLAPMLENSNRVVIMDNARIHHAVPEVEVAYGNLGHKWRFLPAYSPDFNPTENVFSKLKLVLTYFRYAVLRDPMLCVSDALSLITQQNVRGWFNLCGYKA